MLEFLRHWEGCADDAIEFLASAFEPLDQLEQARGLRDALIKLTEGSAESRPYVKIEKHGRHAHL